MKRLDLKLFSLRENEQVVHAEKADKKHIGRLAIDSLVLALCGCFIFYVSISILSGEWTKSSIITFALIALPWAVFFLLRCIVYFRKTIFVITTQRLFIFYKKKWIGFDMKDVLKINITKWHKGVEIFFVREPHIFELKYLSSIDNVLSHISNLARSQKDQKEIVTTAYRKQISRIRFIVFQGFYIGLFMLLYTGFTMITVAVNEIIYDMIGNNYIRDALGLSHGAYMDYLSALPSTFYMIAGFLLIILIAYSIIKIFIPNGHGDGGGHGEEFL